MLGIGEETVRVGVSADDVADEAGTGLLRRAEGRLSMHWAGEGDPLADIATGQLQSEMLDLALDDGDRSAVPPFSLGSVALRLVNDCVERLDRYDIVPDTARTPARRTSGGLSAAGATLASVLHGMLTGDDRTAAAGMCEHRAAVVPGFRNIVTEQAADGSLTFRALEDGVDISVGPGQISARTLRLLCFHALMASTHEREGRRASVVCVEQAERGLHPWLIGERVESFRDFATRNQVILTTHSPAVVDAAKPEEVVIVEKVDGVATARRVSDREDLDVFLRRLTLG